MSTKEDIQKMKASGLNQDQIEQNLKSRGISEAEIQNATSQNPSPTSFQSDSQMEPSLLPPETQQPQYNPQYTPQQTSEQTPPIQQPTQIQEYQTPSPDFQEYQPYQSYSSGPSSEMISEITEQIVAEKLSVLRKTLEKSMDIRNTLGSKIEYLEERLKRIEKTLDVLQSSVLRKVGDYVTDVQDIKTEMTETQKSLQKLFPELKKHKHTKKPKHKKKK